MTRAEERKSLLMKERLRVLIDSPYIEWLAATICLILVLVAGVSGALSRNLVRVLVIVSALLFLCRAEVRERVRFTKIIWWLVVLFMAVMSVLALYQGNWIDIYESPAIRFSYNVLLMFIVPMVIFKAGQLKKALVLMMLSLFLNDVAVFWDVWRGISRPVGLIKGIQDTAVLYLLFLPVLMVLLIQGKIKNYRSKFIGYTSLLLGLVAMFLNNTRGVWVAMVVMAVFIVIYCRRALKREHVMIAVIALTMIGVGLAHNASFMQRIDSTIHYENTYYKEPFNGRADIWKSSVEMFVDHPLIGVGLHNYRKFYKEIYMKPTSKPYNHAHNVILQIGAENGLLGLIPFLTLFFYLVYWAWQRIRYSAGLIMFTVLLGMGVYGLSEYQLQFESMMRLFWLLLGFCFAAVQLEVKQEMVNEER